ncbi:hypothetical protein AB0C31_44130, partial [Actinoplanes philippinensis]
ERHFGEWQGHTMAEVAAERPEEHARWTAVQQRRLALTARMVERDFYLWCREHEDACSAHLCGFFAEPTPC